MGLLSGRLALRHHEGAVSLLKGLGVELVSEKHLLHSSVEAGYELLQIAASDARLGLPCERATVQAGEPLSAKLEKSKHFPPLVAQMLAVGEETGQIDQILLKIAEFYEEEVDAFVAALSSIIEPLMIVVLGSIVGVIAASVFGPISSISTNIK